jgi:sorbitol-specific phosphotransferase system component IIBC
VSNNPVAGRVRKLAVGGSALGLLATYGALAWLHRAVAPLPDDALGLALFAPVVAFATLAVLLWFGPGALVRITRAAPAR